MKTHLTKKGVTTSVIVAISVGLALTFVLLPTLVLPYFNASYNTPLTGVDTNITKGIILLTLILALVGIAVRFLPSDGVGG